VAIREFMESPERQKVAYFGEPPANDNVAAFKQRGYELIQFSDADFKDVTKLVTIDSAIFSQDPSKPTRIVEELKTYAPTLLNYDCKIYVRVVYEGELAQRARAIVVNGVDTLNLPPGGLFPDESASLGPWYRNRERVPLLPAVHVCAGNVNWPEIANLIVLNPSGKAPNKSLKIHAVDADGRPEKLAEERELLFQRAFWDCEVVDLVKMKDGLSGVPAFRAYAQSTIGVPGLWPYLYFVKIGNRQDIATEYWKYQENALTYIPFHLGPRLRLGRCCLGGKEGIIVTDFVEDAETLRDCASDGRAVPAIANLFGRTLRSWQRLATPEDRSVPEYLGHLFPKEFPPGREPLVRAAGATKSIEELKALFMDRSSKPVLAGPVHGDLHATNVLVRSADSIVIDFEKVEFRWPLVFDAASLEGGLLVDGFVNDDRRVPDIILSVVQLYEDGVKLERQLSRDSRDVACHPKDASAWFYDCVHQIRLHARHMQRHPGQYATALALALIRKACNRHAFEGKKAELRAAAFFLAEKILTANVENERSQLSDGS
jgi:hypothetical protein